MTSQKVAGGPPEAPERADRGSGGSYLAEGRTGLTAPANATVGALWQE